MSKKELQKLEAMRLRNDQVIRLSAMGCSVKTNKNVTPPEEHDTPRPLYDVVLPSNTKVKVEANHGEAILRRIHDEKTAQRYQESFSRKLTWVRDNSGVGKVTGFTLQFD